MTSSGCYYERMKTRVVSATEFKAKCLSLIDEVDAQGGTITITKRGRPVANLGPARKQRRRTSENALAGKVNIPDEILMADTSHLWDCLRETGTQD